jgi:AraC-like DNA-binding protein
VAIPLVPVVRLTRHGERRESTYVERPAPAPSRDVVACTWHGVAGWRRSLRVLPDGCVDVAWDGVALTATPAAEVVRRVEVGAGSATVGVRLRPVAAGAVLGLPADELQAPTALREVWGDAAVRLEEQLAELPADTGLARLLDAVTCRARLRTPDARLAAAVDLLACAGSTVEGVAAAVGWSPRQLRRHCLAAVGLAPKSLQQVLRFRRALRALGERPLAAVAAEHGYADQAHLTRSMRRHAGATPRALLAAMHSTRVVAAR